MANRVFSLAIVLLLIATAIWFGLTLRPNLNDGPTSAASSNNGGSVALPPVWRAGLDLAPVNSIPSGVPDTFFFPEIMCGGCALVDFDRDGLLDIYLVRWARSSPKDELQQSEAGNRLFRQTAAGQFEDVSKGSGLDVTDIGMGVAVGDANNDGWPDVFLSNYGPDRLLLNQRNGTFVDVTTSAGVEDLSWGASACFADFDRDGWLDLCVVNYLDYDPGHPCADPEGELDYCNPKLFSGVAPRLYRNVSGAGVKPGSAAEQPRFQDVSWESGIGRIKGPGLGVVCGDFNADHWLDIYIANDGAANFLWINQQNGTFKEEAIPRSAAYDNQGRPQASMGIALGDPDADGDADLLLTHLRGENNALYLNDPQIGFTENSAKVGLGLASFSYTGFGTAFVDLELDGDLDLIVANGAVRRPQLGRYSKSKITRAADFWQLYAERNQIFANDGKGQFLEVAAETQPFCESLNVGRGLSTGDVDNDGDIDLLLTEANGDARLFLNDAPRQGHWLLVRAVEPQCGGRDAYGAQITVATKDRRRTAWVNAAGSYLSASDPRVHFGLGDSDAITEIKVIWPNGDEETFAGGAVDRQLTLAHGSGTKP